MDNVYADYYGRARVVIRGLDMVVQQKRDGEWCDVREFNRMSNDYAMTQSAKLAHDIARYEAQNNG